MKTVSLVVAGVLLVGTAFYGCSSDDDDSQLTTGTDTGTSTQNGGSGGNGAGGFDTVGNGGNGGMQACATASAEVVPSPVDIIIAIDQSASMGQEIQGVRDNLSTNLVQILAAAQLDYRVIFVTSTTGLPMGPEFFQVPQGVNSSDALTLFLWTYDGFGKAPNTCDKVANSALQWSDKLRYDGHKVFIAVTDDDPSSFDCAYAANSCQSNCGGCANSCAGYCPNHQCPTYADSPAAWGGDDFPTELYKLLPAGMFGTAQDPKWTFHAIVPVNSVLQPSDPIQPLNQVCNASGNTGETSGVEYQKLAVLTGGLRFPSCDTDYSPVFQDIASTIIPLACKFPLEQTNLGDPDPSLTNVEIDWGDGMGSETIFRDETAACDGGADGWQYTDGGTAIVLCGPACDKLKNTPGATVNITVGCEAVVR